MNRKFYVFIAMLAILLLSVSVASAADDTAADGNLTADSAAIDKIESENTQNSHVLQDDEWVYTEVNAEAQNILVGHDQTITAKLTDGNEETINREFNVSVYRVTEDSDGQEIYPAQTITGNGSFTVASSYFTAGTYFAKATFAGDGKYDPSESRTYFLVESEKQTPVFDLENDEYYTGSDYLDYTFNLCDSNGISIPCSADIYVNGVYRITLHQKDTEDFIEYFMDITERIDYEIRVVFKGDDAFNAQNYTFTMHPREKRSWISIDAGTVVYGHDAVIEVELTDDDGILNSDFIINILENGNDPSRLNMTYTATGSKTITIPASKLKNNANYTVTATYAGNSIYTPCTATEEFSVTNNIQTYFQILVEHTAYMESGDIYYAIANKTKIWYDLLEDGSDDWVCQYIDIYLNGNHLTSILTDDEQREIIIDNLHKGLNTISFVFNGTDGYSPSNETFNITNYEKESKLEATIPYAFVGHDASATLRLTGDDGIINEDFTIGLYKYNEEYLGTPLATYVIHNGTGTISIPSSLLKYGEHILLSHFEGNDKYSLLYKFTHFFVHDEKEYIYITADYYPNEVYTDYITLPISVQSNGNSVPCLMDVYVNGKFKKTVNYTGRYSVDVKIDGLKLGKNVIRFAVNESDLHQSATASYEITYSLLDTETYIQCSNPQSSMEFGVEFSFSTRDEVYNYIHAGTADIYVNGEKYTTLNFKKDSNEIYYTYRGASPGQYNISVYYPGDEVSHSPSWSENITVTIAQSEVNAGTTTVLNNIDAITQIRAGDEIKFDVTLKNSKGHSFRDYVDIYVNGSKITSLYGYERFTFAPSEAGTYSITARYEGDDVYGASSSDPIVITVMEAPMPASLTASVVGNASQGDTIEIDYSVISNGEAVHEGDENNYIAISLNGDLITTTTDLTGKFAIRLNKAGYNSIRVYAYSKDNKYTFNGQTYSDLYKTCYAAPNPNGRVQTSLVITADSENLQFKDTIIIYNNLSNASVLNCPDELHRLLNESYNPDIGSTVPSAMLRYYLNGELIGTSPISVYGMNSKVKFTLANVNRTGWFNITAVMDDGENVFGCTSNLLSLYVNPIKTRISENSLKMAYNQTHQFHIYLMNDRDNKVIDCQPVEVYVNGVKNETLYSYDSFNFRGLVMGKNNITFIYKGGEGYGPSNCTVVADVDKITFKLTISATQTSIKAGCATDIKLNVGYGTIYFPIPVSIYVNGVKNDTVIVDKYSSTIQVIPVGYEFEVYARYEADEYHNEAISNKVKFYPRKHSTTLKISTDKQKVDIGSAASITLNCSAESGLVDIYANNVVIGTVDLSQTNVYQFIPNKTDRFSIYANYRENGISTCAQSNTVLITSQLMSTVINIQTDKNPIETGSSADITVELFDSYHTITDDSVDIYVNYIKNATLNLAQGNVFRFTPAKAGAYEIYAKYNGNATHSPSESYITKIIVNRIATGLIITSDKSTIELGDGFTISVNLTSKGNTLLKPVILDLNSRSIEATDKYVFTPENAGTYDISAHYNGDDTYDPSQSDSIRVVVNKRLTSIEIAANSSEYDFGSAAGISINLTSGGTKLAGTVEIYVNGIRVDTVDLNSKTAYNFTPSKAGTYSIQAKYIENAIYSGSASNVLDIAFKSKADASTTNNAHPPAKQTVKLTLKKVKVKRSAKKLVLTATLKINGKAVKGKVIKFKFNKKNYKAKTNSKGVAKVTIKKKVLKKLKAGKKVKYQASYGKTIVKKSVKVKK